MNKYRTPRTLTLCETTYTQEIDEETLHYEYPEEVYSRVVFRKTK